MQDVTELPAEDGAAGQREAQGVRPERVGSLLPVCPQNDACPKGQGSVTTGGSTYRQLLVHKTSL